MMQRNPEEEVSNEEWSVLSSATEKSCQRVLPEAICNLNNSSVHEAEAMKKQVTGHL